MISIPATTEQTRAAYPDAEGFAERDGVRLFWECYGAGERAIFLLPTWSIIHSRHWKAQIPYLSRHFRVLTFDGRGNGRSDRPGTAEEYSEREFAADAIAVIRAHPDFDTSTPASIAEAIASEIGREVDYRPVETDGAARAASMLAELL